MFGVVTYVPCSIIDCVFHRVWCFCFLGVWKWQEGDDTAMGGLEDIVIVWVDGGKGSSSTGVDAVWSDGNGRYHGWFGW